jgi:serralysin
MSDDIIDGGSGYDVVVYGIPRADATITLLENGDIQVVSDEEGTDILRDIEAISFIDITISLANYGREINGTEADDELVGTDFGDYISGLDGDDILNGSAGDDTLIGGDGDDTLIGGSGADIMQAGAGNDTVWYSYGDVFLDSAGRAIDVGGAGRDALRVEAGSHFNSANLSIYGFEEFHGAERDDRAVGLRDDVDYHLSGGAGNDTLIGAGGDDTLIGGSGADIMQAGAGNDTVWYSYGDVFLDSAGRAIDVGGAGRDALRVEAGSHFNSANLSIYGFEEFHGAERDDRAVGLRDDVDYHLSGGAGNDTLIGAGGDDTLIGGSGADIMQAGAGNDTVWYSYGDVFLDSAGRAIDVGGAGRDALRVEAGSHFNSANLSIYGFEEFHGAERDDRAVGLRDDVDYHLSGGAGNDTLIGAGGDDTLIGGSGADIMQAGAGNDTVWYSYGDVFLDSAGRAIDVGGAGRDALRVEAGSHFNSANLSIYGFEEFHGAERDDRAVGLRDDVDYHLSGGAGNDTLIGAGGDDTLIGGSGADIMQAGAGNDTVWYSYGDVFLDSAGRAIDVGGAGRDALRVEAGSHFNSANLSIYGFEEFHGAERDDRAVGLRDDVDYHLSGGAGNDTLIGAGGDDTLIGGSGADIMQAGAGNDTVWYSYGDVFLDSAGRAIDVGGAGRDALRVEAGSHFNSANLSIYGFEEFHGAERDDRAVGLRDDVDYHLSGGAGNDTLIGAGGDDTLIGGSGADIMQAGAGNDTVWYSYGDVFLDSAGRAIDVGGAGRDALRVEAGSHFNSANLSIYGFEEFHGAERDDRAVGLRDDVDYHLSGGAGNDTLIGAGGDDTLIGGSGADIMQAGAGNDTVWYSYGDVFLDSAGRAIDVGGAGRDALRVEAGSHFNSANLSIYGFEEFHGAERDDRAVGLRDDVDYHLSGGAGNDELQSAGGEDTLEGGAGNDTLHGGAGSDAFHFNMNDDEDIIADFEDDIDTLVFTGLGDIDDVGNVASQVGTDVVFNFGSGDVLIVRDTTIAAVLDDIEIA